MPDGSAALPVFPAMTPGAFEEDRRDAMEAVMNERIAKPIDIGVLKGTIEKYL